jgi:putative transposase
MVRVSRPRKRAENVVFDAGKKVKGRKRHVIVDVLGMLLAVGVTAASIQDRDGTWPVLREIHREHPAVQLVWVDSAYGGDLVMGIKATLGVDLVVVKRPDISRASFPVPGAGSGSGPSAGSIAADV